MIISSPEDRKAIEGMVRELSNSMLRVDSERELQKEILDKSKEELGMKKNVMKKIANLYHRQEFDKAVTEANELESLYEEIFPAEV